VLRILLHFSSSSSDSLFEKIFRLITVLIKVEGQISQIELSKIDRYLSNELGLKTTAKLKALRTIHQARRSNDSLEAIAEGIYRDVAGNSTLLEAILDILLAIAYADGIYCTAEDRLLKTVAHIFRLTPESLQRIEARAEELFSRGPFEQTNHGSRTQFERSPESFDLRSHSFKILGCSPDDSVDEIKKKYRALVKEFHPDMVLALGAPPEFKKVVENRFRSIQEAYEEIRSIKGFA
jgi:DnaJ like chaperone protein